MADLEKFLEAEPMEAIENLPHQEKEMNQPDNVLYFANLWQRLDEGKDFFNPYGLLAKKIQVFR